MQECRASAWTRHLTADGSRSANARRRPSDRYCSRPEAVTCASPARYVELPWSRSNCRGAPSQHGGSMVIGDRLVFLSLLLLPAIDRFVGPIP